MGKVIRKLAEGTVPEKTIFDKRLVVECCETFHLHWRNLRLELDHANWQDFIATMLEAERTWRAGGSPSAHNHFELLFKIGAVLHIGEDPFAFGFSLIKFLLLFIYGVASQVN